MGRKPKKQKVEPVPVPVAPVTAEDESIKGTGDAERRRLAQLKGRNQSVTSQRGGEAKSTILG